MIRYILSGVLAYLLGSLSFGIILSKIKYKKDIREYGSNNAGMTNMLRTFGKGPAAFVFIFDALKGTAAVLIARYLLAGNVADPITCAYVAGVCAVLGHLFPLYFGFKGGKGAATALGAMTAITPVIFPCVMIPFFIVVFTTKYVSLSSMIAVLCLPISTFFWFFLRHEPWLVPTIATSIIAFLIVFMHRSNIKRLINGTENKIGSKKEKTQSKNE